MIRPTASIIRTCRRLRRRRLRRRHAAGNGADRPLQGNAARPHSPACPVPAGRARLHAHLRRSRPVQSCFKGRLQDRSQSQARRRSSRRATGIALAIRDQGRGQIASFYATRGFWPLWASSGRIGPEADKLIAMLKTADLDGLDPSSYRIDRLRALVAKGRSANPQAIAEAELALSAAFADYVADIRKPRRVRIKYLDPELKPRPVAARTALRGAALQPSLGTYMATMGWMSPHYARLRALLARAIERRSPREIVERLRLNLDRARLLPGPWTRHVVVDAASARLWYYEGGKQRAMMRVVVGAPETETPMLAGMVRYAILNPYWNVPDYLIQRKLAPKIVAGATPASLRMEVLSDWSASPRRLTADEVDWPAVAAGRKLVRMRQLPGGANAMGRVKFMFPNDLGIYLHDTPDKGLLSKPDRHLSNGCIRLQDAPGLYRLMFGPPSRRVQAARARRGAADADPGLSDLHHRDADRTRHRFPEGRLRPRRVTGHLRPNSFSMSPWPSLIQVGRPWLH
ncbi:L,D-transpeptidase family protein [Rhizorhabdus histidinilytica]